MNNALPKIIDENGNELRLYTGFDAINALRMIESFNFDESDMIGDDDTNL